MSGEPWFECLRRVRWFAMKAVTSERHYGGWSRAWNYFWAHRRWWLPRWLGGKWTTSVGQEPSA